MKKKLVIFNYSLLTAVLFAILFQSVHSFEHIVKQLTTKHCDHKYNRDVTEFTHSHNDFDHCFVCEYSFSNYTPTAFYSFEFYNVVSDTVRSFGFGENCIVFSVSTVSLRGPPSFIV